MDVHYSSLMATQYRIIVIHSTKN